MEATTTPSKRSWPFTKSTSRPSVVAKWVGPRRPLDAIGHIALESLGDR
jgi:hypothetical protein